MNSLAKRVEVIADGGRAPFKPVFTDQLADGAPLEWPEKTDVTDDRMSWKGIELTKLIRMARAALLFSVWIWGAVAANSQGWRPTKPVEIVVGSAPGSGADATARTIQNILQTQKIVDVPVIVVNKPGANAVIAMQYLGQADGDGHRILLQASAALIASAAGALPMNYFEFTPVARLVSEPIIVLVRADSSIRDAKDMVARLKANPGSVSVGQATSIGSAFHIAAAQAVKAAGADPRKMLVVPYQSSSQVVSALLGGSIDTAWLTPGTVQAMIEAKKVRIIAAATKQRIAGPLGSVPTLKELGAESVVDYWRGIIGPRKMTPEQLAFWHESLGRMVASSAWHENLVKNQWIDSYLTGPALVNSQRAEFEEMRTTLGELGLTK